MRIIWIQDTSGRKVNYRTFKKLWYGTVCVMRYWITSEVFRCWNQGATTYNKQYKLVLLFRESKKGWWIKPHRSNFFWGSLVHELSPLRLNNFADEGAILFCFGAISSNFVILYPNHKIIVVEPRSWSIKPTFYTVEHRHVTIGIDTGRGTKWFFFVPPG